MNFAKNGVHLLERGEGRQDGAANPHGVLTLRGGDDLDLHGGGSEGDQLLGHALANAAEQRLNSQVTTKLNICVRQLHTSKHKFVFRHL